ncbi:MAG: MBL fold metallo-hydrolase [Dehalococcoidia bacterium]|nr:MBL fold metallo-hydrolase [Dehalococcoidia bacterium]
MEVAPGVHQIRFNSPYNPNQWVFAYLIVGDGEAALVDAGWASPHAFTELKDQVEEAGVRLRDIRTVVLTHLHPDHFGLAGRVKAETDAQILIHELEKPFVETRYRSYSKLLDELADWLLSYGAPEHEMPEMQTASVRTRRYVQEVDPDDVIVGGELLKLAGQDWEVIWTPGHTRGHLCLYNRRTKTFISGDHILPGITPNISLHPESSENPLGDFIASLRKLVDLPVETVLPGHEHAFRNFKKRIRDIEEHHEERLNQMLRALTSEPKTGYQVAASVKWRIGDFSAFDVWARRSAMMETLAHLEYLRRQGVVEKVLINGVFHYRARATTLTG